MNLIKKILCVLLLTLTVLSVSTQSSLLPLNHCLGTCSSCASNQLSTCSGQQFINCTQAHQGPNCPLKPSFIQQLILIDPTIKKPTIPWKDNKIISCTYPNNKKQLNKINLLGFYTLLEDNYITIDVQPYYQNFILNFNLVRGNWTPFSDRLKIVILEQNYRKIGEEFIQLSQRDNANTTDYALLCNNNNQHYIIEKYEISGILNPDLTKKLTILFQGMIFSGSQWSLTNVRLSLGCSNFLIYDGTDCQKCLPGYYPLQSPNTTITGCQPCPLTCTTCTNPLTCTTCIDGYILSSSKCINNNFIALLNPPNKTLLCPHHIFLISSTLPTQQKLQIILTSLPSHTNKTRLVFHLAYQPSQFLPTDLINIEIDGKPTIQISGSQINTLHMKPKQLCNNFGSKGYYAFYKIISPYFDHNQTDINITVTVNNQRKIGVENIGFQYQAYITKSILNNHNQENQYSTIIPSINLLLSSNTQQTDKISVSNINLLDPNQSSQIITSIQQIQKDIQQVKFGIKQGQKLTITVFYPLQLPKLPYISAYFNKIHKQIPPEITKQTNQYQQLVFNLSQSLLNQNITLFMLDTNPNQLSIRNLQSNITPAYLGNIKIVRYDYISQEEFNTFKKFAGYFQSITWIAIISTFVLSIFSNSVITQKFTLLLQVIFLHVYIYTEYLPASFKLVVGSGLQRIQTMNYFSTSIATSIQKLLLGNVIQLSPPQFKTFLKDINFIRAVYPSLIVLLIYLLGFTILNIIRKIIQPDLQNAEPHHQPKTNTDKIKLFICSTSERFHNFWHQVWQYLFITFVFAGLLQFYNLNYPNNSNRNAIINDLFCFACLIIFLTLPIITFFYLNNKYQEMDYSDYVYWNENILFQKLPIQNLPTDHHRILIIICNVRYFLLAICFAFLGQIPIAALGMIIIINTLNLGYLQISKVQINRTRSIFNTIQHILLIILSFSMIITYILSYSLPTQKYILLGYLLSIICLLLTFVGLAGVFWSIYYKINGQETEKQGCDFKPAAGTQRVT